MELILLSICPLINFFLAKRNSRNPWIWAILGIPLIFVSTIILFLIGKKKDPNRFFNEALITHNFSPDYISENRAIAIDSKSKNIMLKSGGDKFRVYSPDEVMSFVAGYDYIALRDNTVFYKYYIEFRVKDLDNPNPRAWFGGYNQERDKWLARVTAMYSS